MLSLFSPIFLLSLFLTPWTLQSVASVVYLILDGLHNMINSYRRPAYNNFLHLSTRDNLVSGSLIMTDKYFNRNHAIWCLLLGIVKGSLCGLTLALLTLDNVHLIIYSIGLIISFLTIISEISMLIVICQDREHEYISINTGMNIEPAPQVPSGCCLARYRFEVRDNDV